MKRWVSLAARIYPQSWREEYGKEFDALLDDVSPGWRIFANVLGGAIRMQITTGTNMLKLMIATAAIGAILAGGLSYTVPPNYVSSAAISVTPQPDPVRTTSPQVLRQRANQHFAQMKLQVLSRRSLATIINTPSLNLYRKERELMPLEDVENLMRRNIRIEPRSSMVYDISFSCPDQAKAQATVRALATRLTEENAMFNRNQANTYKELWLDLSAMHLAKLAPPPPPGDIVTVIDQASLPTESVGPNRFGFLAWGLLLGLLAALAIRWPRRALQLAGFGVIGFILTAAASFLIPNRYTATAVMEILPAVLTEDPSAPLPPVTPAAEFLRQMEPKVLSRESLSEIIMSPRLDLYRHERAGTPMEQVVSKMSHDIHIASVNPPSGAFSISFSYSDRRGAQNGVNMLITRFIMESTVRARENARKDAIQAEIVSRRGGEYLDILDPPSMSFKPDSPNRLLIATAGFGLGLLGGAIKLFRRHPATPSLQPA